MNLTYKQFNTDQVLCWHLYIEEYHPEIKYIKGSHNVVADALSCLPITDKELPQEQELNLWFYYECFEKHHENFDAHPLSYKMLDEAQQNDKSLMKLLRKETKGYHLQEFHGGGKTYHLICYNTKNGYPKTFAKACDRLVSYPGINRTEESKSQDLWWPKMREQITSYVQCCSVCQRSKRKHKKYGILPPKEAEAIPWDKMCIDLIGPYKIRHKGQKDLECKCVTMINPATGWFEIHQYDDKRSITVANIAEKEWFMRYPWPTQVTYDRGSEFIGKDFQKMIKEDYGITTKPITVRNPQANAIVERIHQVIANMIPTFELEDNYLDENDPWKGILSATAFAIHLKYHTTLQKLPGQLVFGRDMILNITHRANWEYIRQRKQGLMKTMKKKMRKEFHTATKLGI